MNKTYDIAFLGHYTKDTIVSAEGTRVVDGGAFNYGAHAAVRMGLKVAAITRLAREDFHVVDELRALGVDVFARATPRSTCLRLEYPTSNVDERILVHHQFCRAFHRFRGQGHFVEGLCDRRFCSRRGAGST